ncbi:hypothetical protein EVAR_59188_1 [Eumeta japonica]|uniref:Cuticle protein 6 n=1 Tax=Eumeta variegata TaxID=151549 RepID=A0A4C1ZAV7_EUMVA|nr:hypothetical protein EVAR_59188_1 [Eumeta japonica]
MISLHYTRENKLRFESLEEDGTSVARSSLYIALYIKFSVEARTISSVRQPRLSLAAPSPSYYYTNINGQPGTYSFGYEEFDPMSGNTQFRNEERYANGTVVGRYGYLDAAGRPVHYSYIADEKGYRVKRVKNQNVYSTVAPLGLPNQQHHRPTESSVSWTRGPTKNKSKSQPRVIDVIEPYLLSRI